MDYFTNVFIKDSQVRIKINDVIDRYNRLPYNYQSKIGYDTLIQNVILKELINLMGPTIVDTDKKLKKEISRIKYLESKILLFCTFILIYMAFIYLTEYNIRCY